MTAPRLRDQTMSRARRLTCGVAVAVAAGTLLAACGDSPGTSTSTVTVTATTTSSPTPQAKAGGSGVDTTGGTADSGGSNPVGSNANGSNADGAGPADGAQTASTCDPASGVPSTVSADMRAIAPPSTSPTWRVSQVGGNPCAGLSWVEVLASAAPVAAPRQLLIYHDGRFLGTGIRCQTRYQEYVSLPANDAIHVTYRYPDPSDPLQSTTQNPVGVANVDFRWNGSRIVMEGTLPSEFTQGKC
ncbi:LppP/LprE family lipoprotein [Williamsia sp. M5A3_1d]